ncbi:response regulator [Labilibacter sediminis]|nr:response regulator [Labilibacter sediminis]
MTKHHFTINVRSYTIMNKLFRVIALNSLFNNFAKLLIVIFVWLSSINVVAESNQYQKSFISVKDGLSQNEVTSIVQDKYGFMWFGTSGGLNRFDGYRFKQFKPSLDQKAGLNNPAVERLLCDSKGNILVGTKSGGASVYNQETEHFLSAYKGEELEHDRVISLFEDNSHDIYLGRWKGGLIRVSEQRDSFQTIIEEDRVNAIVRAPDSTLWVAVDHGLKYKRKGQTDFSILFDTEITDITLDSDGPYLWLLGWKQELIRLNYLDLSYKEFPNSLLKDEINHRSYTLEPDKKGNLWIGTWGKGLFKFNKKKETYSSINIYPDESVVPDIGFDVILDIFEDRIGDIWVGTHSGIVKLSPKSNFKYQDVLASSEIRRPHVSAVLEDMNKNMWIGTKGNGLFFSDIFSKEFKKIPFHKSSSLYNRKQIIVKDLKQDPDGNIWVSVNDGLYIARPDGKGFYELVAAARVFKSPDLRKVTKAHGLLWDDKLFWVGTQQKGVYLFKLNNGKYEYLTNYKGGLRKGLLGDNRITSIKKGRDGNMFFGTYNGLYYLNQKDTSFNSIEQLLTEGDTLLCDIVLCTHLDNHKNLWFGTPCNLNRINRNAKDEVTLTTYTNKEGLADDYINSIISDDNGNLWMATNSGISTLNPETGEIRNFDENDGIGEVNFTEGACFKGEDGILYFGGYSSYTYFNPLEIKENISKPQIVVTNFSILNKEVLIEEDGILSKSINETEKIELSYEESEFSIEFASLDYKAPSKNLYAYKLEGYNDQWVNIGNRRHISFSNLDPGDYTLLMRGTNSNGVWNSEIKKIEIKVLPAPWKSLYAIVIYVLIIMGVVLLISWIGVRQERLENSIELEKVKRQQEQSLNDYKLSFFTNISHELRTPLTLILAPVKDLLKKEFSSISGNYFTDKMDLIYHNTSKLYNLVNQLLEFRKIEDDKVSLFVSENNVDKFVEELSKPFHQLAELNGINYKIVNKASGSLLFFDRERMAIVLNNLLSNAFKFVGKPGRIKLALRQSDDLFYIDVINNGKVIPADDLKLIFERFYQIKGENSITSSGIGLELVKTYTQMHHGKVSVTSDTKSGTVFTVALRKGKEHFTEVELETKEEEFVLPEPVIDVRKAKTVNVGNKGAKVLIAEDNEEVREYLISLLSEQYEVVVAEDGLEGFDLVIETFPDIIISDVMMPRMDGFEFCEKVKSNDLISHIPVILLTAKVTDRDMLFGTRRGADVYLKKPFDPELLLEKIKQLLSSTKRLEVKYSQQLVLEPRDAIISKEEGEFLNKAIEVVENNIGDASFDPEYLATEMAMSVSTFYRKLKKISQQTPGEFIKSLRLKRAAQLLIDTDLTVSEIIENVGYIDIRTFRKNFKETYNNTPALYRKEQRLKEQDAE